MSVCVADRDTHARQVREPFRVLSIGYSLTAVVCRVSFRRALRGRTAGVCAVLQLEKLCPVSGSPAPRSSVLEDELRTA